MWYYDHICEAQHSFDFKSLNRWLMLQMSLWLSHLQLCSNASLMLDARLDNTSLRSSFKWKMCWLGNDGELYQEAASGFGRVATAHVTADNMHVCRNPLSEWIPGYCLIQPGRCCRVWYHCLRKYFSAKISQVGVDMAEKWEAWQMSKYVDRPLQKTTVPTKLKPQSRTV